MTPSEMSNEELAFELERFALAFEGMMAHPVLIEAGARLRAMSAMIPRPKIEAKGLDKDNPAVMLVNDGFFMGFNNAYVASQQRERLMHLLGMEGGVL